MSALAPSLTAEAKGSSSAAGEPAMRQPSLMRSMSELETNSAVLRMQIETSGARPRPRVLDSSIQRVPRPFGRWPTPISSDVATSPGSPISNLIVDGSRVFWVESEPIVATEHQAVFSVFLMLPRACRRPHGRVGCGARRLRH